jgi:putative membrane protein
MLFIKGIIIGIGKVIPGVSGSMLAISMGIYQKLLDSINNFFRDIKNNFLFLFKIGLGVFVAIVFFSKIILKCLNNYYIVTMFFFIGLILGSFKDIDREIKKRNKGLIIITFLITLILGLISVDIEFNIKNTFLKFIYFIIVGFVDAFTMIVPGISGTATLMMIGAYNSLMETFSNLLNFNQLLDNILIMIPFLIGLFIGVIFTVKLINYLFKKCKDDTYSAIIGFCVSTIILMFIKCINSSYTLLYLILAFIMLIVGFTLSKKINHYIFND